MLGRFVCLAALAAVAFGQTPHFTIDASKGNKTSFAISAFIETNINRGDDGGLYAELLQNRAFQESNSYLTIPGWTKVGPMQHSETQDNPLGQLQNSLQIFIPGNKTAGQQAGVRNTGWWGIPVLPQAYQASLWVRRGDTPLSGDLHLSLASLTTGATFAATTVPGSSIGAGWTQISTTLTPTAAAPDTNNVFNVLFDVTETDQEVWITLVSLFPPTWKGRKNGLRTDLAQSLADLEAKFIRVPGGSNLQGDSISLRFNWSNTIGPLEQRPGRVGLWVGWQTEGFGIMEQLDMIEDMGATAVLGVYDGYSSNDESVPNNGELDKYIQDAIHELDFILGDPKKSTWAAKRAALGRPQPWKLQFVEIGNEDFTATTYDYRWTRFYNALKAAYPQLTYIASASLPGFQQPVVDNHDYSGHDAFISMFNRYDNTPRNGPLVVELENAVISTDSQAAFNDPPARLQFPTLQGAIAEAVFNIGMQRNGDLVLSSAYAPYLNNIKSTQWTPNLINFNLTHVSLSTSYYVQQMISKAKADKVLPVTSTANFGPLYWVATSANSSTFFFQVANVNATAVPITGTISNINRIRTSLKPTATVLAAKPGQPFNVSNTLDDLTAVVPVVQEFNATVLGSNIQFSAVIPGRSFQVLRFDL